MESILPPPELPILWRLADRPEPVGELSARWEVKYQIDRPRAYRLMIDYALTELVEYPPAGEVTKEELLVLLQSDLPRVRELALRLAG